MTNDDTAPTPDAGSDLAKLSARARNVAKRCLQRADMDEEISKDTLTEAATVLEKMAAYLASASSPPAEDLAGQGERARHQRDLMFSTLHKVGVAIGLIDGAVACDGPQLIAAMEEYCDHLASSSAPDLAGQGEPVAWAYEYLTSDDEWKRCTWTSRPASTPGIRNIRPLYAAPAPSRPADRGSVPLPDLTPVEIAFDTAVEAYWREHFEGTAAGARRTGLQAAIDLALRDAPRNGGDGWSDTQRDAERFRALMRCGRIKMQGSAGVDPETGKRTYRDTPGQVHFGAEFWPQADGDPDFGTRWGRHCLRALADDILAAEAPPSPNAGDETQEDHR